jgi:hypothetical protein
MQATNLTIITNGKVSEVNATGPIKEISIDLSTGNENGLKKYHYPRPVKLETNGGIIETFGPLGVTLEIISHDEARTRFPDFVPIDVQDGGLGCSLVYDEYGRPKCGKVFCSGSCPGGRPARLLLLWWIRGRVRYPFPRFTEEHTTTRMRC